VRMESIFLKTGEGERVRGRKEGRKGEEGLWSDEDVKDMNLRENHDCIHVDIASSI